MNIRLFSLVMLLTVGTSTLVSAAPPLRLKSGDVRGWTIGTPDTYAARELYGYINGGAEIYLEYGFTRVVAQRCTRDKHEFQVDIYEMKSPRAAFGMFSTLRGRCAPGLPGVRWHCVAPEQILFAKGKYLVSIVPYDRAAETRSAATTAAKALLARIREADYRVPAPFSAAPFSTANKTLRFIQGPLAVQGVLGEWAPWLDRIERFDLHHVTVGDGARATEAAVLSFRTKRDAERFLSQSGMANAAVKDGWRIDRTRGIAMRTAGAHGVHVLWGQQMDQLRGQWRK